MSWGGSGFLARRAVLAGGVLAGLACAGARGQAGGEIGGPFALEDQNGRKVTDRDLRGRLMLVYFGYTRCPDLCPTSLAKMARVLTLLSGSGVKLRAVFITVDPVNDTPSVIGAYARQFSPDILALTGTQAAISKVTGAYHVFVGLRDPKTGVIKHGSRLYLMAPDGQLVTIFSDNEPPEKLASVITAQPRAG